MECGSADGCSEISPAKERGKFVAMNHIGFVVGLAVGLWYVSRHCTLLGDIY